MFLAVDQMRAHMVFDDLRHQSGHGAAGARDQMHDLVTARFARKRPLNALNLASDASYAGEQFLLVANGVTHGQLWHTHPPYKRS